MSIYDIYNYNGKDDSKKKFFKTQDNHSLKVFDNLFISLYFCFSRKDCFVELMLINRRHYYPVGGLTIYYEQ